MPYQSSPLTIHTAKSINSWHLCLRLIKKTKMKKNTEKDRRDKYGRREPGKEGRREETVNDNKEGRRNEICRKAGGNGG